MECERNAQKTEMRKVELWEKRRKKRREVQS